MTDVNWDDATVAKLREMRAEGFTSTQIARVIGSTCNAVIWKCKRLGIGTPIHPHARADLGYTKVADHKPESAERAPYTSPKPIVFDEPCEPVPTVALPMHGRCKWPVNDQAPWLHCGKHADGVWCSTHKRAVYSQQPRRAS